MSTLTLGNVVILELLFSSHYLDIIALYRLASTCHSLRKALPWRDLCRRDLPPILLEKQDDSRIIYHSLMSEWKCFKCPTKNEKLCTNNNELCVEVSDNGLSIALWKQETKNESALFVLCWSLKDRCFLIQFKRQISSAFSIQRLKLSSDGSLLAYTMMTSPHSMPSHSLHVISVTQSRQIFVYKLQDNELFSLWEFSPTNSFLLIERGGSPSQFVELPLTNLKKCKERTSCYPSIFTNEDHILYFSNGFERFYTSSRTICFLPYNNGFCCEYSKFFSLETHSEVDGSICEYDWKDNCLRALKWQRKKDDKEATCTVLWSYRAVGRCKLMSGDCQRAVFIFYQKKIALVVDNGQVRFSFKLPPIAERANYILSYNGRLVVIVQYPLIYAGWLPAIFPLKK